MSSLVEALLVFDVGRYLPPDVKYVEYVDGSQRVSRISFIPLFNFTARIARADLARWHLENTLLLLYN